MRNLRNLITLVILIVNTFWLTIYLFITSGSKVLIGVGLFLNVAALFAVAYKTVKKE